MNDKKKELIKYKLWMFVFPLVLLFILFAVFLTKIGPETITSGSRWDSSEETRTDLEESVIAPGGGLRRSCEGAR